MLIVPNGHDPSEYFATINNAGIVHQAGSALNISSAYSIHGYGSINDHVNCQGTLSAPVLSTGIILNGGLTVAGTGHVGLGYNGSLYVKDSNSEMSGGNLELGNQYIGFSESGEFSQSGGTNTISSNLYLGYSSSSNGTYNLSGSGQLSAHTEYIGYSGAGTFTQTGGTNTLERDQLLYLGYNPGSSGTYNLSGTGQLQNNVEYIGYSGTGTFTQTGGTNKNVQYSFLNLIIGSNTGSGGTYNLSGTGVLSATNEFIGQNGTGVFNQTGGTNTISSDSYGTGFYIGYNSGSYGTYNLSATGKLYLNDPLNSLDSKEYIGYSGTGVFNQTGGSHIIRSSSAHQADLYLGYNSGASGTYDLSGSGELSTLCEYVGYSGNGAFIQSGGTNTIRSEMFAPNRLYLGYNSASLGTYDLSGTGQLISQYEYIGLSGTGVFNQTGGTNTTTGNLVLGSSTGSSGTYNLTGGTLIVGLISKGSGTAAFNFGGGTLQSSGISISLPMTLTDIGGNANVNVPSSSVTIAGDISGIGGLNKLGNGTLTLSGTNTFTGPINIKGGLLNAASRNNLGNGTVLNFNGGGLQFGGIYDPSDLTMTFQSGSTILDAQGNNITLNNSIGNGGQGGLTKLGTGTLTLSVSPSYLGPTVIGGGILKLGSVGSGVILPSTTSINLSSNSSKLDTSGNWQNITSLAGVAGSEVKLGGGNLTVGSDNSSTTFSGTITSTVSGGSLTKVGTGIFTLSGTNTYNGPVNFNGGLIKATALNNLGTGTVLNFNGGGLQFAGIYDPSLRTMSFQTEGAALDTQANNITLAKAFGNSGMGSLTKLGSGKLTLNALNTYSGDTIVKGGAMEIAGGIPTSGTSLIDVQSGMAIFKTTAINKANLDINTASSATFEVVNRTHMIGAISGGGITQVDSNARLTASSINQNTLTIGSGAIVTIQPIAGGPLSGSMVAVPEPSSFVLIAVAFALLACSTARKKFRRED